MNGVGMCVIFNPAASRGQVRRRLREVRACLGPRADFRGSRSPGHAEELALQAAAAGYAAVVAAGGDGTVHEVANGLLRAGRPEVAFGVIPLGSGNDYADSLGLPPDCPQICQQLRAGGTRAVDVGEVRDDRGRSRYFVNTLGLGLSGAVTVESRKIHGLRGILLYGVAALQAICRHFHSPEMDLTFDDLAVRLPTLYFCVALGKREGGGFIIAPDAELDDGLFDYLHAGRMNRWQACRYLPRLAQGRIPNDDPLIRRGRCRSLTVHSPNELLIHTDGELFTMPGDRVRRIEIRLLPGLLRVCGT